MQQKITNQELLRFLKNKHIDAGFVDSLKLHYRPLICPYVSLIEMVPEGARVGDIGCGTGQFFLLVNKFARPSFLFGIEVHQKLIDNCRDLMSELTEKQIGLETYDGINFPPQLGTMDILFLIDVLHHVPKQNQELFLHNLAAAMKSGSTLVIKDIEAANPLVYCNKLHDLIFSKEIGHELKSKNVAKTLESNGLQITGIQKKTTYVYPHYTIVAKKP